MTWKIRHPVEDLLQVQPLESEINRPVVEVRVLWRLTWTLLFVIAAVTFIYLFRYQPVTSVVTWDRIERRYCVFVPPVDSWECMRSLSEVQNER